jgi:hypothetical protein
MDNWIYSTYNAFRIRWTPKGEVLKEPTAPKRRPVGPDQDDYGKVWFVDAGSERGPVNFQTPIQYGAFNVDDQFDDDFRVVWPAYMGGHADTQGGMGRVRMPVGVLNHFTGDRAARTSSAASRLPDDLRGDLLFAEPVGRLERPRQGVGQPGPDAARERLPRIGVHHQHRSAVPPGEPDDRARRHDLRGGHVPRHHPGIELDAEGQLPAARRSSSTASTR